MHHAAGAIVRGACAFIGGGEPHTLGFIKARNDANGEVWRAPGRTYLKGIRWRGLLRTGTACCATRSRLTAPTLSTNLGSPGRVVRVQRRRPPETKLGDIAEHVVSGDKPTVG